MYWSVLSLRPGLYQSQTDHRFMRYVLVSALREAWLVPQTDQRITRYVLVSAVRRAWRVSQSDQRSFASPTFLQLLSLPLSLSAIPNATSHSLPRRNLHSKAALSVTLSPLLLTSEICKNIAPEPVEAQVRLTD